MKPVFIDTSAILALLVADDPNHEAAARVLARLAQADAELVTTSYVLVETYALLGRRLGREATRRLRRGLQPLLSVRWLDEELNDEGLDLLEERDRSDLSLVDAVPFVAARVMGAEAAFAFDRRFSEAGFRLLA